MFYRDDLLRAAMAAKGWNHRVVAGIAGYDRMTVGRVLRQGGDPRASYQTVFDISKALGFERIPDEPVGNGLDVNTLAEILPTEKIA